MPSVRRVKVFAVLVVCIVVTTLFYTSSLRQQRELDSRNFGDFYSKTVKGMENKKKSQAVKIDEDAEIAKNMAERLKQAAQVAKNNANAKAPKPDPPSSLVGVGSAAEGAREEKSVAGRKKYGAEGQKVVKEESQEEHDIETELNTILRKSPIIVFSKSYCPFSRKAKMVLEKYIIDPAPHIVELDLHPLGPGLQARLAELTGRKTVPNVLINAVSIGGGDDVADLDENDKLIDKIIELGNKKIEVKAKPVAAHGLK
ncbi:thioredoxin-like protein [Bisporella sp. PMI_857]|nr:thioredoxin-like protein [Bisporella sp. PMI_857]